MWVLLEDAELLMAVLWVAMHHFRANLDLRRRCKNTIKNMSHLFSAPTHRHHASGVLAQLGADSRLLAEWLLPPPDHDGTSNDSPIAGHQLRLQAASAEAMQAPRWIPLSLRSLDVQQASSMLELRVEIQGHGTLFALRQGGS